MQKTIIFSTVPVLCVLAAYTAGVRSARADGDPCYTLTNPQSGCSGCQTEPCALCTGGNCSGTTKQCNLSWTLNTDQEHGWNEVMAVGLRCWSTYTCVPANGGTCNVLTNPCWLGTKTDDSDKWFSTFIVFDLCGGGPE